MANARVATPSVTPEPADRRIAPNRGEAFRVVGMGVATPANPLSQSEAIDVAQRVCCEDDKQRRIVKALFRRAGVKERRTVVPHEFALEWEGKEGRGPTLGERMALYETHAAELALDSAAAALEEAGLPAERVTHLVTVSCTGFEAPGVDIRLIKGLGMSPSTERVNVGFMGCHGAMNGIRVARGLAAADPTAVVLIVSVELCSLHYGFGWDPDRLMGNTLFADGSGAIVAVAPEADLRAEPTSDAVGENTASEAAPCGWRIAATGSRVLDDSEALMSWRVRDHGFEMTLDAELPVLIESSLAPWLEDWLAEQGLAVGDVATWAVHPGGPRILTATTNALRLPDDATAVSRSVLAEHGNMSSATLLFVMNRLRKAAAAGPCVMIGFGPGIVAEVALWR